MQPLAQAARVSQILVGLVFLAAGTIKVAEPVLFYWNVLPHARFLGLNHAIWPMAALLLGPVECILGLALLINWRPAVILPAATILTALFLVLMIIVWHLGVGTNCGCFGNLVERSPGEAAVEDAAMLGLLVFAWWGLRGQDIVLKKTKTRLILAAAVLSLVAGGFRFFTAIDRLQKSDLQAGMRLTGINLKGTSIDLMEGDYLLELFSPTCNRCQKAVYKLNQWTKIPGIPSIVGLTAKTQDSPELIKFKQTLQPNYPIATISQIDFVRLTWRSGFPRLAYVHNGSIRAVWEYYENPTQAQIKQQPHEGAKHSF